MLTQVILGDVQWKIAPSLILWSTPPLPRKRGLGHTVDRYITACKELQFSSIIYYYPITAIVTILAKLQDHSPGVKGLLATQLRLVRGLVMMIW